MGKTYAGYSDGYGTRGPCVVLVLARERWEALAVPGPHGSADVWWGDGGSGALVLASAILADHFGYVPPADLCRQFTWDVVGRWPQGWSWRLDTPAIDAWLDRVAARATRLARRPQQP